MYRYPSNLFRRPNTSIYTMHTPINIWEQSTTEILLKQALPSNDYHDFLSDLTLLHVPLKIR